jgi:threonine dehydrogenase-like Zn-dependent dehydrogenase
MGFLGTTVARLLGDVTEVRRDTRVDGEFDVVVEAAGTQGALDIASRLVAQGGRLVVAGFHQDGPRTVDMQSWNWRRIDVINAHERDPKAYVEGLREAVLLACEGILDVGALVTHRLPLSRLGDAFELARTRPDGFLKAVVCP